jgi:hypothetical protein
MGRILSVALLLLGLEAGIQAGDEVLSHPPLRTAPPALRRPAPTGPVFVVDAQRGDDGHAGSKSAPWKTLRHAIAQLKAGATLYLRGGVYYEQIAVRLVGRADAPITIAAYPGEAAILDGSIREFTENPAQAWTPRAGGFADEFRSSRNYPNLRTVMGWFGDSMIGLHTYYHADDLRSANERWDLDERKADVKALYCGPGLWYDPTTGNIHCRLKHTHLPQGVNYGGVTDPRKLPLVVAPFRSVPLHVDGARHVRFQDLVIRGGGYDTIVLDQAGDIEFDNVTVWAGSYGLRATGTQGLKVYGCGFYGSVPPWTFRTDTSLRTYPERNQRDITRLGTHALLVPEAGREFSVYAFPMNDDWEIAHCDFTDAHDGVYLGAVNVRFHHNRLHDLQDDGIYLSPMYPRYGKRPAMIHLEQNHISRCLTALAFGGPEKTTADVVVIARNVIDLRTPLRTGRPSSANPKGGASAGKVMGDHGSPPWSRMKIYQNTCLMAEPARSAEMGLLDACWPERPRVVFNNVFVHRSRLPPLTTPSPDAAQYDGNLYWLPGATDQQGAKLFAKFRAGPLFAKSKAVYPAGFHSQSRVADPKFAPGNGDDPLGEFALSKESPAIDAGIELPADCPDPLRKHDAGRPDVGALPWGTSWCTGRRARP